MNYLIKSAKIIDPNSTYNGTVKDVLIVDGNIESIGENLSHENAEEISLENLHLSPGWFDMRANFRDPGHEYKEDLETGISAAAAGGFTGVMIMPSTSPPINTKADVDYVIRKAHSSAVDVLPAGTLSHQLKGENISEMFDMHQAGAIAFTDDKKTINNPGLLTRALMYTQNFDGLVISFANDKDVYASGQMNEGITSTKLGLKGIPALAEELQVARDIYLTEYTEGKLHFATLSTAKAVGLIRAAKANGLNITAEIAAHQIALNDSALEGFDSNYKVLPPLRTNEDIQALTEGLKDGTIDAIVSDHSPEDVEHKKLEFDHAEFGIIGLQTAYALANTHLKDQLNTEEVVAKFALNPRKILGLEAPTITEGSKANITLFDPNKSWALEEDQILSKSKNTPFVGTELIGKPLGIFNKGQLVLN